MELVESWQVRERERARVLLTPGGGCCAYPAGDHSVVPVPVELRRRFRAVAPAVVTCEAEPGAPRASKARCALQTARRAIEFMHELTERHHTYISE